MSKDRSNEESDCKRVMQELSGEPSRAQFRILQADDGQSILKVLSRLLGSREALSADMLVRVDVSALHREATVSFATTN
jgi:hypothetical protein